MQQRDYFMAFVILSCIGIMVWAESTREKPILVRLDCNITFDTFLVTKDWTRGAYPQKIRDSIVLSTGYDAFDTTYCTQTRMKNYKPLWPTKGGVYYCQIDDLYPPFKIYKGTQSDTLTVIQNGKILYFRIPCNANVDYGQ